MLSSVGTSFLEFFRLPSVLYDISNSEFLRVIGSKDGTFARSEGWGETHARNLLKGNCEEQFTNVGDSDAFNGRPI